MKEALELALEALEINLVFLRNVKPFKGQEGLATDCIAMTEETITAIKEALAQPETYKGISKHLSQSTDGRVCIDPVTGNFGIGSVAQPENQGKIQTVDSSTERKAD